VPNDIPDWSGAVLSPALSPGTFTVPANTTATVYSGATQPGTHALKVYCQSADPTFKAAKVVVTDTTTGFVIEQWLSPVTPNLLVPLDDVSVPTVSVAVTALAGTASVGSVVFLLSDQAVAVSNDIAGSIPVDIAQLNGAFLTSQESGGVYQSFPIRNIGRIRTIRRASLGAVASSTVLYDSTFTDPLLWSLVTNIGIFNCSTAGCAVQVKGAPSGAALDIMDFLTPPAAGLLYTHVMGITWQSPIDLGLMLPGDTSYQLQVLWGPIGAGASGAASVTLYAGSRW
jgi:hypothetical protein